eukprot:scaffold41018_cov146-Skeletonema_marinoi.AAC.1
MYIDGETAMVESNIKRTLDEKFYDRFFGQNSSKHAFHRMRLIEQYVKPEYIQRGSTATHSKPRTGQKEVAICIEELI